MSTTYAITIKVIKQGFYATESQLLRHYQYVVALYHGTEAPVYYEKDSLGRFHLHSQFFARKGIKYSLARIPYTHIYIVPLRTAEDQYNWVKYCQKEEADEALKLEDFRDNYMFI